MAEQVFRVWSDAFKEGDWIPNRHAGHDEDVSPSIHIEGIHKDAQSLAITMDDASHPIFPNYNHWVIWNLPVQDHIPEALPRGHVLEAFGEAHQGIAYGRHRYRGPKPPLKCIHTYVFTVYSLDCKCELSPMSKKKDLLAQMEGHILQKATLSGKYQSHRV